MEQSILNLREWRRVPPPAPRGDAPAVGARRRRLRAGRRRIGGGDVHSIAEDHPAARRRGYRPVAVVRHGRRRRAARLDARADEGGVGVGARHRVGGEATVRLEEQIAHARAELGGRVVAAREAARAAAVGGGARAVERGEALLLGGVARAQLLQGASQRGERGVVRRDERRLLVGGRREAALDRGAELGEGAAVGGAHRAQLRRRRLALPLQQRHALVVRALELLDGLMERESALQVGLVGGGALALGDGGAVEQLHLLQRVEHRLAVVGQVGERRRAKHQVVEAQIVQRAQPAQRL